VAQRGVAVTGTVYQLRVVLAGISPMVWRRLLVPAETSVAGLHEILQAAFGWSDEHLHRFTVHAVEYGLWRPGSAGFSRDARQVPLAEFGLRVGERFTYEYNFFAAWRVNLRLEQIADPQPERAYPRCTGGRRAGPPEDWDGPWEFLERTQPHLVSGAIVRASEIIGQLLDADEHHDWSDAGQCRDELAGLAPLLSLGRFDRRACNQALHALALTAEGSRA